jgi:hypothetical protein
MHLARIRALAIVGVLAIAAVVLVVLTMKRDTQHDAPVAQTCPSGYIPVNITLPESERDVKINVFNATKTPQLAGNVAADFTNRRFTVIKVADEKKKLPGVVAQLRFGPKTVGAAHLLKAYFLNDADNQFDPKRKDDVVDVVIGGNFKQLATPTEMRQAVAALGNPDLPDGTCKQ